VLQQGKVGDVGTQAALVGGRVGRLPERVRHDDRLDEVGPAADGKSCGGAGLVGPDRRIAGSCSRVAALALAHFQLSTPLRQA
jgi:hypothetical protein